MTSSATSPDNHKSLPAADKSQIPTLADLLLDYLSQLGVEYVFGIPGGAIEPLYNALARSERAGKVRGITARHEAGAAFMADGYARETGSIGVCCATTGPGTTNLITGVANAYVDRVPMLVLTAQTSLPKFGKNALQDSSCSAINTVGMFEHCTCYNTLVSHKDQFETKLMAALMTCLRKQRPVHLSLPSDILFAKHASDLFGKLPTALLRHHAVVDLAAVEQMVEEISHAKQMVIFLGDGCGEAIDTIMQFAELTNAGIITGPMGKRWMNAYHPHCAGVFGYAGHQSARELLQLPHVNLILAVGTALGEMATGGWDNLLINDKLIHIDATAENFTRSAMARLHVSGHIRTIFEMVNERVRAERLKGRFWGLGEDAWLRAAQRPTLADGNVPVNSAYHGCQIRMQDSEKCLSDEVPIKPQRLMRELSLKLGDNARLLVDTGNAWAWATHYFHTHSHRGHYRISMAFGSMGWAIGAAIGTAMACRGQAVVCLTGDGSYLMSGQEITVAVAEKLPVIFVILNDHALGMIKFGQRLGDAERIGWEIPPVDFAMMARAVGADGYTVRTPEDLVALDFKVLAAATRPCVIDVYIDPEEIPPMGTRVKGLKVKTPGQ